MGIARLAAPSEMVSTVVLDDDLALRIDEVSPGEEVACCIPDLDVGLKIDVAGTPQDAAHHRFTWALGARIDIVDDLAYESNAVTTAQAVSPVS